MSHSSCPCRPMSTHTHTHAHAPHAARQHTHLMSHSSCPCRPMSTHTHTHTHAHEPHAALQHTHLMSHSSCPCRPMSTSFSICRRSSSNTWWETVYVSCVCMCEVIWDGYIYYFRHAYAYAHTQHTHHTHPSTYTRTCASAVCKRFCIARVWPSACATFQAALSSCEDIMVTCVCVDVLLCVYVCVYVCVCVCLCVKVQKHSYTLDLQPTLVRSSRSRSIRNTL